MFLRKIRIHKDGKEHGYWSLVETMRTADGPRQRTLCYLGELNDSAYARWQKTVDGAADLGKKYMQLTEVEAAFRALKSELAIRPLFHQLEKRVKAHVLVAFRGYALQVTLKHLLKRSGSEYSPAEALNRLEEIRSVDIVLPTVEGREIWLRASPSSITNSRTFFTNFKCSGRNCSSPLRF